MPTLHTYRLFISHAWEYNSEYYRIVEMLDSANYFDWWNYSVPEHDPLLTKTNKDLYKGLYDHIKPVQAVIVLAGMYVPYRQWIQTEIEIAKSLSKPIIGIKPYASERVPIEVANAANIMVGWNTNSILDAIRKYSI